MIGAQTAYSESAAGLLARLRAQVGHGVLFGQQNANVEGMGWSSGHGVSDVYRVVGDYPAVFGFDLSELGTGTVLDQRAREELLGVKIREAHRMGAIVTASWHMNNPVTGGAYNDLRGNPVRAVLADGPVKKAFLARLDVVAKFLGSLRDDSGETIPVIFRPLHEHNGFWFWWGILSGGPSQFRALFRMTVVRLREHRGLRNLLIAYSPDVFVPGTNSSGPLNYFYGYPGDDYVDVFGFDDYRDFQWGNAAPKLRRRLAFIAQEAAKRGKVAALTEGGLDGLGRKTSWKRVFSIGKSGSLSSAKAIDDVVGIEVRSRLWANKAHETLEFHARDTEGADWAADPSVRRSCVSDSPMGDCAAAVDGDASSGFGSATGKPYSVSFAFPRIVPRIGDWQWTGVLGGACRLWGCEVRAQVQDLSAAQVRFWTESFASPVWMDDPWAGQIAYAVVWRNYSALHHFGPYPEHFSADDFRLMKKQGRMKFLKDWMRGP